MQNFPECLITPKVRSKDRRLSLKNMYKYRQDRKNSLVNAQHRVARQEQVNILAMTDKQLCRIMPGRLADGGVDLWVM